MKDLTYVLHHFFTHKDFLVSPDQIPGTLFTPLHLVFEAVLLGLIIGGALWLSRHREKIRPVLAADWAILLVWEFVIIWWDSTQGLHPGLDIRVSLSLYPCSLFLWAMPMILWGKGIFRRMGYGYLYTLGLLGAAINFLYPFSRLQDYSCLSFPAFHTFAFHGSMLFAYLTLLLSGAHRYEGARKFRDLLIPSGLSLIESLPANVINYTLDADYMYFRGKIFLLQPLFGRTPAPVVTVILYVLYLVIPALFYLPSYLKTRLAAPRQEELVDLLAGEKLRLLTFR